MAGPGSEAARRLFVFSHPNHELGMFGLLGRPEAHLLVLSDGGGAERVRQTRRGLARLGLEGRATFMDVPETAYYDALLAQDRTLFDTYVDEVRKAVERVDPDEIYCDAVEHYNPGHDMTLPIVWAALGGQSRSRVFEVPLIHERADGAGYRLQQVAPSLAGRRLVVQLTPEETALKTRARDEVYRDLDAQLGTELLSARDGQLTCEELMEARPLPLERRPEDMALRYEARGELLRSQGHVEHVVTYEDHWQPMVRKLLAASEARS
ncbi:MAG: hypothetical protein QNJ90_13670 [Planctomycetota bacterium]|nr:hypothetical protein [Planctomycetota bacterium]